MTSKEDLQDERRHLQRRYEEQLDDLNREQNKAHQNAEELAEIGGYWIHKIDPEASTHELYREISRYENESDSLFQKKKRDLTTQYEDEFDSLTKKIREKDNVKD